MAAFRRVFGVDYNSILAGIHWLFWMAAFTLVSVPGLIASRQNMPRRYIDDPEQFDVWNQITEIGAYVAMAALAVFILIMLDGRKRRVRMKRVEHKEPE